MTTTPSSLLQTIEADLKAGVSYLEDEALGAGLFIWNTIKTAFIALEPAAAQLLIDVLTGAVASASAGASVEAIETSALNTAKGDALKAIQTVGSAATQQLIIGIRANLPAAASGTAAT
jgi:hypothetical protein